MFDFINKFNTDQSQEQMLIGLIHGACLVFIDALNVEESNQFNPYQTCLQYLLQTSQQFITNQLNIQQLFESIHQFIFNSYDDFQFYVDQLMHTKQSFAQMIKVLKMIYDFSLLDEKKSAIDSFKKVTSELKINIGLLGQYETVSQYLENLFNTSNYLKN